MLSSRVFQITLVISLITHGVILFQNPNFPLFLKSQDNDKLEVSYVREPVVAKEEEPVKTVLKKELLLGTLASKIAARKINPPPFVDREAIFNKSRGGSQSDNSEFIKPAVVKPDIISVKKIITTPAIDLDKINNPSYISYYQIVREKIRRAAYHNYDKAETGEVYMSFIITREGFIRDVRLIEAKSSVNAYLKETALKSVSDASPFPSFPKVLDYPQLSFNVVISFEVE
jgi:TonB family protein